MLTLVRVHQRTRLVLPNERGLYILWRDAYRKSKLEFKLKLTLILLILVHNRLALVFIQVLLPDTPIIFKLVVRKLPIVSFTFTHRLRVLLEVKAFSCFIAIFLRVLNILVFRHI